jgi:uncharacterized membrane protein
MATETAEGLSGHVRGITVTTVACFAGILAALVSNAITGGATNPAQAATAMEGLYVLAGAIVVQLPVLKVLGVDLDSFSKKDVLYVIFMTFALWFVSWGIILTAAGIGQ